MKKSKWLTAVVANEKGQIFDLAGYAAMGADGPLQEPLTVAETSKLPFGGELMYLPGRKPVVYDMLRRHIAVLEDNPYAPGEKIYPVAAFNSPGYVITHTCAYEERPDADYLPLFSYAAVGWQRDGFRSPVIQVDDEPRQDLRQMPREKIEAGVRRKRRELPDNRLRAHLEKCALTYGCPAGKNFFLQRFEAPLPTSSTCNARCLGCISLQSEGRMPSSQDRITFTPTPAEIAEVALAHIRRVKHAVVSFGQGCEGDPLMKADVLIEAIRNIRAQTEQGTINLNTNASLPGKIEAMARAGLDSLRVSMNSVRKSCYLAYFRPKGYYYEDVLASIDKALAHGTHVAINYLNCPGFTDTPQERDALLAFLAQHPIHMIQWRNLNFDPLRYIRIMNDAVRPDQPEGVDPDQPGGVGPDQPIGVDPAQPGGVDPDQPIGVERLLTEVRAAFPMLRHGYFNPPKEKFKE